MSHVHHYLSEAFEGHFYKTIHINVHFDQLINICAFDFNS